ncbi:ecdysteroid-regulated 16 kDa protein-like [Rhynchophorus ferrugineus]|uniref:ecdysteroid-regulated 16 kDa protein-like n=1 Tax=Rhynchophorus ferrugineus TaxID=354439 RepID=UPI003FCDDC49
MDTKLFIVVVCLLPFLQSTLAGYTDCGSADGSIIDVSVTNCAPTARRCILKRNTNATMTINFKSNVKSDSLTAEVHGIIMGVPVAFDLPNTDGCKDSGIVCPLSADSSYEYTTTMPIKSSYPRITVEIKWQLIDDEGKNVICALIPAKIS